MRGVDPVELELFRRAMEAIAEEMGAALQRASFSPNIKERLDFSCALFDAEGRLVAQAAHIPVHLGSMPDAVAVVRERFPSFEPGDVIVLNDPYDGGNHLPDVTMVTPVFRRGRGGAELVGFVANRAHHADVGGMSPGSMPVATEIFQEGLRIPPIKLWAGGVPNEAAWALILRNVRTPEERRGDLLAQHAANRVGARRLRAWIGAHGIRAFRRRVEALLAYGERLTRAALASVPPGEYRFEDALDDDGVDPDPVRIAVTVRVGAGELEVDFAGSAAACRGSVNTVLSVTKSAVYYVVRCLLPEDAPTNAGVFAPVRVRAPVDSVVHAAPPHAVAGGNVETSQRIVDALLGALAKARPDLVPAASQGTMNNVAFGGADPRTGRPFAYYETLGGGMGAGPQGDGLSGVHVHMSNTRNTPVEALEHAVPVRVRRYAVRDGSGGEGRHRGGDGLVREFEFLAPAEVTLLTDRRRLAPWGMAGGRPGQPGRNVLRRRDGTTEILPGKVRVQVAPGDCLCIETPGGGGWGEPTEARDAGPHGSSEATPLETARAEPSSAATTTIQRPLRASRRG